MNLGEDFGLLLSDRVLATNAIATITIHKALKFLNVDANSVTEQGSRIIKDIGNLTVRS